MLTFHFTLPTGFEIFIHALNLNDYFVYVFTSQPNLALAVFLPFLFAVAARIFGRNIECGRWNRWNFLSQHRVYLRFLFMRYRQDIIYCLNFIFISIYSTHYVLDSMANGNTCHAWCTVLMATYLVFCTLNT